MKLVNVESRPTGSGIFVAALFALRNMMMMMMMMMMKKKKKKKKKKSALVVLSSYSRSRWNQQPLPGSYVFKRIIGHSDDPHRNNFLSRMERLIAISNDLSRHLIAI
ncbi:hypothetical protein M0804_003960 [Polistes exclamans]|nr:hypothetical protein M0804_003960 [Polistes exclamans]